MIFTDARWLWALAALPVLALLEWLAARRADAALERLAGRRPNHALLGQRRPGDRRTGAVLRLAAIAALAVGAAGPEWGREMVRRSATGSDIILAIDVSASMDARDVAPSRLDEARREALTLLGRLEGSRVAVVAFAGDAVRLCPLTLDRGAARLVLESLSSTTVSTPGTDVGRALRIATRSVPGGRRDEQAIILWTDGEDLEQGAREALEDVARTGIRIYAVGVGTPAGDVVPTLGEAGRPVDVKRDASGGLVRSRLDESLLRAIARRTRGAYFAASRPGGELPRLLATVGTVARSARGSRVVERPIARFRVLAGLAIALLALEMGRARRRRTAMTEASAPMHSERTVAAAMLLALTLAPLWPRTAEAQSAWARGDQAFKAKRWAEAESLYARRLRRGGPDDVRVNLATARALKGDAAKGESELARLADREGRSGLAAGYNVGTLRGGRNEFDPALAALRQVLERDPTDEDARWNYEVLLRRKERQRPNDPNRPPQPKPQSGGGGGNAPQQPTQGLPNLPQGSGSPPPRASGQRPGQMDRAEAERLLGALEELSRTQQQRQRKVPVNNDERRGRDW